MQADDTALTWCRYRVQMTTTHVFKVPPVTTPDTTPVALMTAEELLLYPMPDKRVELVRGHVVVREPPGMHHGECAVRVVVAISTFLHHDRSQRGAPFTRGRVFTCDTGFTLARNPDTVRGPDVAYVSRVRWAGPLPQGYGEFAPDLAVEIRSPGDRPGAVLAKVGDWLEAGALLVWVVDPARALISVYRADGSQALLGISDALDGGDVLPGFALALAELFAE